MSDRREDLNSPEEAQLTAMEGLQSKMWTALPGIVADVDLEAQTCSVQPSIQGVTSDRNNQELDVNLPLLINVPIVWPRAGGFALTMPLAAGDEVLVIFSSRAIDSWWQNGGVGTQVEARMHDLSDGFAIPGPTSQPKKLANVSATGAQLRNEAGTAYIEITVAGAVNIVAPGGYSLVSPAATHNTKNIGATHQHLASGGSGLGGVPA